MRKKEEKQEKQENKNSVIEIEEEVKIGDYVLEAGDKIEVLNESFGPDGMQEFENLVNQVDSSGGWKWQEAVNYILTEASDSTTDEMLEVLRNGLNQEYL